MVECGSVALEGTFLSFCLQQTQIPLHSQPKPSKSFLGAPYMSTISSMYHIVYKQWLLLKVHIVQFSVLCSKHIRCTAGYCAKTNHCTCVIEKVEEAAILS